ncbi:MAG: REP element-mobilizing transposase RayT [Planctomycetota bacterium]|jgi:REP element-mobilizing transposase RayT
MTRKSRRDVPGAWHHVINRGLARRTVFENRECMRYFQSRIAHSVRRKELEIHVLTILTTHYHLLVRSPTGQLAEGMRRIQNEYVRWFNRRNLRDGSLFRGRFQSLRVEGLRYRRMVVGYIDRNAVSAGIASKPESYEYGSARYYAGSRCPSWLARDWVERDCLEQFKEFSWSAYKRLYLTKQNARFDKLVEQRINHPARDVDPLDDLVHSTPSHVLQWMRRKAALADGSRPGLPCASTACVLEVCRRASNQIPWTANVGRRYNVDLWQLLEVALLRDLAGLRWDEIAQRSNASPSAVKRRYTAHRDAISIDGDYTLRLQKLSAELLAPTIPSQDKIHRPRLLGGPTRSE